MKVLAVLLTIHLNVVTKIPKEVFAWEVPGYEDKYGDAVHVGEAREVDIEELPDVGEELERLTQLFGEDADTKQKIAERAYGRGRPGLAELEKHMQAAVVKPKKAEPLARTKAKAADAAPAGEQAEGAGAGDPLA